MFVLDEPALGSKSSIGSQKRFEFSHFVLLGRGVNGRSLGFSQTPRAASSFS
jgi:hypothetical protein